MNDLERLSAKLCRELAQSELDAALHPTREARRLGAIPPADALRDVAAHARELQPLVDSVIGHRQPIGIRLGHAVGRTFSGVRHAVVDRFLGAERSYRATLLGLRHGLEVAMLLRHVAARMDDHVVLRLTNRIILRRVELLDRAVVALDWFAAHPRHALLSGRRHRAALRSPNPEVSADAHLGGVVEPGR